MKKIPYTKHKIFKNDLKYVIKSLKSEKITEGKYVDKFEKKIQKYLNVKYALACTSGTAALHMAISSLGIGRNDIVIVPSINFIAISNILSLLNAKIIYADVDPITGQMTPQNLIDCIKFNELKNIKAFCTMYLGGAPNNIFDFYKIKKKYKCFMIEDACHALGSTYFNKKKIKIGSCKHSDICTFSLHPAKTITSGEGGIVTTNNLEIFNKAKLFRSHGIVRSKDKFSFVKHWKYNVNNPGLNYRMSDLNAALAISQLNNIDKIVKKRNKMAKIYFNLLKKNDDFILPIKDKKTMSSFHLFIIKLKKIKNIKMKEEIIQFFLKKKIILQQHYIPFFKYSFYKNDIQKTKNFNGANSYFKNSLSFPLFYDIKEKDIKQICKLLNSI